MVVQLVRIPACHAGGRGFESRPLRQNIVINQRLKEKPLEILGAFFHAILEPHCPHIVPICPHLYRLAAVTVPDLSPKVDWRRNGGQIWPPFRLEGVGRRSRTRHAQIAPDVLRRPPLQVRKLHSLG